MIDTTARPDRRWLVAEVLRDRGDALVIAGLGTPAWDVAATGDRPEDFCLWGGMGLATPIGLGVALAQPARRVLVITGDGDLLMGLGNLATIAAQAPENLAILVLDNERFGETGGQTGLTAARADIAAIAAGAGMAHTMTLRRAGEIDALRRLCLETPGPGLAVAKVADTTAKPVYPPQDGGFITSRFRDAAVAR